MNVFPSHPTTSAVAVGPPLDPSADRGVEAARDRRPPGWAERASRGALFRGLEGIRRGRLTVRDIDGSRRFGTAESAEDPVATITVLDPSFYTACAFRGVIGAAEAYMDGAWVSQDLTATVRVLARNRNVLAGLDSGTAKVALPLWKAFTALRRNTRTGSRRNIAAHYDLGNEMFELFLDPTMTYSSALFEEGCESLEEAQTAKYERICRKLDLRPEHRVLEIGTGWGGFAIHAASTRGCHVTTTTISAEQHRLAGERIARAGLADRVDLLLCDYRELTGTYDRVVSIEMIEAVGHEYMDDYFHVISERLAADGACALQAIVNPDQVFEESKRSVDFIRRHVFPGGHLPCVWSISDAVKNATDLRLVHLEDAGPHYARTLREWRRRFESARPQVRDLGYSERFERMWEFYLCYCEGGFLERSIGLVQVVLEKPMARRESILGRIPASGKGLR